MWKLNHFVINLFLKKWLSHLENIFFFSCLIFIFWLLKSNIEVRQDTFWYHSIFDCEACTNTFYLIGYSLGLVYFLDRFSLNAHQAVHQRQKSEKWDLEFRTGVQDQLDHFTAIFCSTVGNWALQWNILIKQVINTDSDNYDQPQESEKWELENKDRSSWLSY